MRYPCYIQSRLEGIITVRLCLIPFTDFIVFSRILDSVANCLYHCVSGCMTAQVAHEIDYQNDIEAQAKLLRHYPIAQAIQMGDNYQYQYI